MEGCNGDEGRDDSGGGLPDVDGFSSASSESSLPAVGSSESKLTTASGVRKCGGAIYLTSQVKYQIKLNRTGIYKQSSAPLSCVNNNDVTHIIYLKGL